MRGHSMMSIDWEFPYPSQRMPVLAKNCVATSNPLAAQAGLSMLAKGGNAIDAALATAITLTVVEPTMNGLGSDAFAIVWDGKLHGINASGWSPQGWTKEHFTRYKSMPVTGWDSVTIPGAVSGWVELWKKWGKLPFTTLFEAAIQYAEQGYLVSPITAANWKKFAQPFQHDLNFANTFLPKGRAPYPGELFTFFPLAQSLKLIAETKGEAFYRGILAEKIAAEAKKGGALLAESDLANYYPQWISPLTHKYRECDLYEMPPNGQGLTVLIALGILQHFDMKSFPVDSADSIHIQIETMKLAFADAKRTLADPRYMTVTPQQLLDPIYLAQRAKLIDRFRAQVPRGGLPPEIGTVYLTAADASGMMVSFIQSHYLLFGSGIVIPNTGICMQNRGACFTLEEGHPNEVGGHKFPFHTIIPGFVMKENRPLMSFGVMGGYMQAQGHVQVMVRLCDYHQNPQTILDAPRWYISPEGKISLEPGIHGSVLEELQKRGHEIEPTPMITFGGGQAIYCLEDGFLSASDPRKDGQALGF